MKKPLKNLFLRLTTMQYTMQYTISINNFTKSTYLHLHEGVYI